LYFVKKIIWIITLIFLRKLFVGFGLYLNKSKEEGGGDEVEEIFNWDENREGCWCCGDNGCECDDCCNGDCGNLEITGVDDGYWFIILLVVLLRRGKLVDCLNFDFVEHLNYSN
jgi:hypothetical protein